MQEPKKSGGPNVAELRQMREEVIDAKSKKRISVKGIDFSCPKDLDIDTFLDFAESDSWSGSTFTRIFSHVKIIDEKITACAASYIAEIYMGVKMSLEAREP